MTPDEIPPEARPLGEFLAHYKGSAWNRFLLVFYSVLILVIVGGATIAMFKLGLPGKVKGPADEAQKEAFAAVLKPIAVVLTLAALGFFLWCLWSVMSNSDTALLILKDGLAFVQGGQVRTCRWGDITEVVYHPPYMGNMVAEGNNQFAYRLTFKDGKDLVINNVDFGSAPTREFGTLLKSKLGELPRPPAWSEKQ
jgi:hypothetical protein